MSYIIFKYIITAGLIVLISELAKISDKIGALTSALPLVTISVLFWLFFENQSTEKIANHSYYTFWYVLPTLPCFFFFHGLLSIGHFGLPYFYQLDSQLFYLLFMLLF